MIGACLVEIGEFLSENFGDFESQFRRDISRQLAQHIPEPLRLPFVACLRGAGLAASLLAFPLPERLFNLTILAYSPSFLLLRPSLGLLMLCSLALLVL